MILHISISRGNTALGQCFAQDSFWEGATRHQPGIKSGRGTGFESVPCQARSSLAEAIDTLGKNLLRATSQSLQCDAPENSGTTPGGVAQLVRVPDCRSGGCGFESRRPR